MKERPILFSAPAATDTKREALELADHPGTSFAAQEMLRRQHARIEELERMLGRLCTRDFRSARQIDADWDEARDLLAKKD